MYRLDFFDGNTQSVTYGQVVHSLGAKELLSGTELSAKSLNSQNPFYCEARRLNVVCFADAWLKTELLGGASEHDRYISFYEVRYYEQQNANYRLIYSGLIDTRKTSWDAAENTLTICCYDKIYLLDCFSDLTALFALYNGYTAADVAANFAAAIMNEVHLNLNIRSTLTYSVPQIYKTDLEIFGKEYRELPELCSLFPLPPGGEVYDQNPPVRQMLDYRIGFYGGGEVVSLVLFCFCSYSTGLGEETQDYLVVKGRVFNFYNNICFAEMENLALNESQGWFSYNEEDDSQLRQRIGIWLSQFNWNYESVFPSSCVHSGLTYRLDVNPSAQMRVLFSGNAIPSRIFPSGFFPQGNERASYLEVLQSLLFLDDLILLSEADGSLLLRNRDYGSGVMRSILRENIIGYTKNRLSSFAPEEDRLSALAGDTSLLNVLMAKYYRQKLAGKWECRLTILNTEVELDDTFILDDITYRVVSREKIKHKSVDGDFSEIRLLAWQNS